MKLLFTLTAVFIFWGLVHSLGDNELFRYVSDFFNSLLIMIFFIGVYEYFFEGRDGWDEE